MAITHSTIKSKDKKGGFSLKIRNFPKKNPEKKFFFGFFFQIHEMAEIFTKLVPRPNHEMAGITNSEITKCGDLL